MKGGPSASGRRSFGPAHLPGLSALITFKVLGAIVGVVWLVVLTSRLPAEQLGLLFGVVALFELTLHVSSLGVNSYCDRFLTSDWARSPRATFGHRLVGVFAWRLLTLLGAIGVLAALMPGISITLGWQGQVPELTVLLAFVFSEGLFRFLEVVLTATLQQAPCQALVFVRGLLRLLVVALFLVEPLTVDDVLIVDIAVTAACSASALLLVGRMMAAVPVARETAPLPLAGRLGFTWRSYTALLLERISNVDVVKLLVSNTLGPAALALFGLAHTIADYAARYMPLALFHGQFRAWLTARLEQGAEASRINADARLLLGVNLVFIAAASPAVVLFGDRLFAHAGLRAGHGELAMVLAALAAVPLLQSIRIALALSAHLRQDGSALLQAGAMTLLVPIWVWAASPGLGLVAALMGCWWLELGPCLILLRRHAAPFQNWFVGRSQCLRILASAVVAAMVAAALLDGQEGKAAIGFGLAVHLLTYGAMLAALGVLPAREIQRIWSAFRR